MNNKTLFLSVVTSALLAACGGGGGDKTPTVTNPSSNSGTQTTTPSNTFTVKAQYKDACGNATPAPAASLIVHDAEFDTQQVINADADGVIRFSSPEATKTISLLIPAGQPLDNGITPLKIETYIDQPMSDMGLFLVKGESQCECKVFSKIEVSSPIRQWPSYDSLSGFSSAGSTSRSKTAVYSDVEVCRKDDGQWPMLSALLGFSEPGEAFATVFSDFSEDKIYKELELTGQAVNIATQDHNNAIISANVDGVRHFLNLSVFSQYPVYAFDLPQVDYHTLGAYNYAELPVPSGMERMVMRNSVDYKVKDLESNYHFETVDMPFEDLLSVINGNTATYDLSVDDRIDVVHITTRALSRSQELFSWSIKAPSSGSLPSLADIDVSNILTNEQLQEHEVFLRTDISAYDYKGITSYQDYNAKLISRKTADDELKQEWQHSQQTIVTIMARGRVNSILGQQPNVLTKLLGKK